MTDTLIQVLLVLSIVAVVFLIIVLWRWNKILIDAAETATLVKKRAHDFDTWISQTENTIKDFTDSFKSFLNTFEQLKNIKNKMAAFLEPKPTTPDNTKKSENKKEE